MVMPTDLLDEIRAIMSRTVNFLSSYQILEVLPQRDQIIDERGIYNHYNAGNMVAMAGMMLVERGELERVFLETQNLSFNVGGNEVVRGSEVLALFRRVQPR